MYAYLPFTRAELWADEGLRYRWNRRRICFPPDTPAGLEFRVDDKRKWMGAAPGGIYFFPDVARFVWFRWAHRAGHATFPYEPANNPVEVLSPYHSDYHYTPSRNFLSGLRMMVSDRPMPGVVPPAAASQARFDYAAEADGTDHWVPLAALWDWRSLQRARALVALVYASPDGEEVLTPEGGITDNHCEITTWPNTVGGYGYTTEESRRMFGLAESGALGGDLSICYVFPGPFLPWTVLMVTETGAPAMGASVTLYLTERPPEESAVFSTGQKRTIAAGAHDQISWRATLGEAARISEVQAHFDLSAGEATLVSHGWTRTALADAMAFEQHPAPCDVELNGPLAPNQQGDFSLEFDAAAVGFLRAFRHVIKR
jgi:hypothetical protein